MLLFAATVVPATAGPVPWVNGHLLWPATFAMYHATRVYFAVLMSLYPTATCLTRPADIQMLDPVPARADSDHELSKF